MHVYIYSPFLVALGGGERYFAEAVAAIASRYTPVILVHHSQAGFVDQLSQLFSPQVLDATIVVLRAGDPYSQGSRNEIASKIPADSVFLQFSNGEFVDVDCRVKVAHVQILIPRHDETRLTPDHIASFGRWLPSLNAVIYPSNYVLLEMQTRFRLDEERVHCIYPPLRPEFLASAKPRDPTLWTDGPVCILAVGRFARLKKHQLVLQAFKALSQSLPFPVKLLIAGPGETPHLNELRASADGMDVEFLVGLSVKQMTNLYGRATLIWSATGFGEHRFGLVETFGLSIAEAMACGCIPIVAGGGGITEIVRDGLNGFVVDTWEEMADRSADVLTDARKAKSFSESACQSVERFRVELFAAHLLAVLDLALKT